MQESPVPFISLCHCLGLEPQPRDKNFSPSNKIMKVLWLSSFALENYGDAAECKCCKGETPGILQEPLGVKEGFPSLQKDPGSSTERRHNLNPCVRGCDAAAAVLGQLFNFLGQDDKKSETALFGFLPEIF